MKRVIFNADDFGLSKGVNKGVAYCLKKGVVSSTSLLTNMPSTENASSIIKNNNLKDVGIHLNITKGKSISGKSSITDNKGNFVGVYTLFLKLFLKYIKLKDIEDEFKSQIEIMIDRKIYPNHIDSHMYVHNYKPIFDICIKLAKRYGIKRMRYLYEPNLIKMKNQRVLLNSQYYKLLFINHMARSKREILLRNKIKTPDHFYGIMQINYSDSLAYFLKIVNNLNKGISEIMCHPGYVDRELEAYSPYTLARERELKALCNASLKKMIEKKGISIVGFNDI